MSVASSCPNPDAPSTTSAIVKTLTVLGGPQVVAVDDVDDTVYVGTQNAPGMVVVNGRFWGNDKSTWSDAAGTNWASAVNTAGTLAQDTEGNLVFGNTSGQTVTLSSVSAPKRPGNTAIGRELVLARLPTLTLFVYFVTRKILSNVANLLDTDLATFGKGASSVKPDGGAAAFVLLAPCKSLLGLCLDSTRYGVKSGV
jgi:hypothetical protein